MSGSAIVVFAGAGASRAVNERAYPTAIDFFQQLPDAITSQAMFQLVVDFLREQSPNNAIDIEHVLSVLQETDSFLCSAGDPASAAGWLIRKSTDAASFVNDASRIREQVSHLMSDIKARLFDFYGRIPEQHELEPNWLALLKPLLSGEARVELFTTNYDRNIEKALELLKSFPDPPRQIIKDGRRDGVQRTLETFHWLRNEQSLLTKLHGSIDWGRGPDGTIYIGDHLYRGTPEKHVVLYPGFKGNPSEEPFASFHSYLRNTIANARFLIFIGFAFRDPYINDILERSTDTYAKLLVIDPTLPATVPYPKQRLMCAELPFAWEAVSHTLQSLRRYIK